MARGWESKAVEAQQADTERPSRSRPARTAEERARDERRRTLELARTRAAAELTNASAPAHRRMLEDAIDALDAQLRALLPGT